MSFHNFHLILLPHLLNEINNINFKRTTACVPCLWKVSSGLTLHTRKERPGGSLPVCFCLPSPVRQESSMHSGKSKPWLSNF